VTHVEGELGAYVLGALDEDEAARVREHLERCESCAAEHAALAGLPELLDLAAVADAGEEAPLSPQIEERLLDRFAREHQPARPERRRRWRSPKLRIAVPASLAGAAIAALVLLLGLGFQQPSARSKTQYSLTMHATAGAPKDASARAALRSVAGGTVVRLWVRNLPGDGVYEVICQSPTWSASAGSFRVDASGRAYVVLTTAARRGQYDTIRVVRHYDDENTDVLGGTLA